MLPILTTAGRVLLRRWPALVAWYLAGVAVHYLIVQLAGYIGAYTATVGFLVLPLAILARLVSYVAMFLVLRDGLRNLEEVAPLPASSAERRSTFLSALLAGILPFFAVYWAQGLLKEDIVAYSLRALEERRSIIAVAVLNGQDAVGSEDTVQNVPLTVWTALIIVLAFAGRWAWTRWDDKLPAWLSPVAVYFEVVWVFFSVLVIGDITEKITGWVDERVAMVALRGFVDGVLAAVPPLRMLTDAVGWIIGQASPVLLAPLAWLTVAGVVFGQAIVTERLRVHTRLLARFRAHTVSLPNPVGRRLTDLSKELGERFRPIGRALLLMWRAGPVLVASYALVYVVVKALESLLEIGIARLIGPHEYLWWAIAFPLVSLVPGMLIEPVRIAVISGAYDATLGRLRRKHRKGRAPAASVGEAEVRAVADAAGLLPAAADTIAAAIVSTSSAADAPVESVGGQGEVSNLRNEPPAS
ncbi:hypothetical protein [Microbacterium sp.]|uniref:hypothetical protein n=1 Tax=Microbacterium sp. TaxID=51671 RepID=UPI0039E2D676